MHNHLASMGITVWQQRHTQESMVRFVFVAESAHADHPLLMNIVKALNCSPDEAMIIWVDDPAELSQQTWSTAPIIVFGEALYPFVPTSAIRTVALTALAQDVPAKKALWQALKNIS